VLTAHLRFPSAGRFFSKNATIGSYSIAKVGGPEIYCKKYDFVRFFFFITVKALKFNMSENGRKWLKLT
jgi:hypothetical protein